MKKAKATEEEARARAKTDDRATQLSLPSALAAYTHPPAFAATRACLESSMMNVYSHYRSFLAWARPSGNKQRLTHAKSGIYIYILEICCHQDDSEFNIHILLIGGTALRPRRWYMLQLYV